MIRVPEVVMGTVVSLTIEAGNVDTAVVWLEVADARAVLHRADAVFSIWKANSPVSRFRRGEIQLEECPNEMSEIVQLCIEAKAHSGGWFDPWSVPGGFDPTGLVKGWAAAKALEVVGRAGVDSVMISAGGDVATRGDKTWRIGITHPWDRRGLVGVVEVQGAGAVCTSGSYERGDHLVDPRTGIPARVTVSATVVGPDMAVADALATGLAAGGDEALPALDELPGYEGWIIRPDGSDAMTSGFRLASPTTAPAA